MWKESYRIGIPAIDEQHQELFSMTEGLLKAIDEGGQVEEFRRAIAFLKDYVVKHFRDEEAYQDSIHYPDREAHKKLHREFTAAVLDFEKKLEASGYEMRVVKDLAGTVTAWLIYHVADADQKIGQSVGAIEKGTAEAWETGETEFGAAGEGPALLKAFSDSVMSVLETMAGVKALEVKSEEMPKREGKERVSATIGLAGDVEGAAVFSFSRELALKLMEILTFTMHEELDELVCSALAEIANISSGNAATEISASGKFCDIKPPVISLGGEETEEGNAKGVAIETEIGKMEVSVSSK